EYTPECTIDCTVFDITNGINNGQIGVGGTVSIQTDKGSVEGATPLPIKATRNSSVTVNAVASSGYEFLGWKKASPYVQDFVATTASYTFDINEELYLYAVFQETSVQPTTYTVAVSANEVAYGTVTGGNTYNENASVTVTATPNSGYQFVNWTENGTPVSTDAEYTFTATADRELVAVFEAIPPQQPTTYTVAVSANNDTYGTVTGGNTYNENATVTVTATPNSGYQFVNWTENGNSVSTAASYTFTVDADRTLVAVFEAIPPQQPQTYNVTVTNGTANPAGPNEAGVTVTLKANTAPSGKIFDKWVVTGVTVANANNATTTFTMPAGDVTAEATYKNAPSGGNLGGGGYYVPTVQKPTIEAGEGVKVTLSADGKVAAIEALEGYELESVKLNDTEKGIVKEVKDLKTGDKLVVTAKKLPTAEETLAALMGEYKLVARSKKTDAPSGRKAIMIRWYDENDKELDFDGVEIFRSVKKNEGFGTKPIFTSKSGKYYNTSIETGTRYYYMVRGYVELDGVKYYTDWSKKAIRTAE
ncbi:MAG: InlB B-repeat-containing protein, partial [Firmicutes bacterium]|nr:InlB B-repeat-containing protein [Bacillota bacterium]